MTSCSGTGGRFTLLVVDCSNLRSDGLSAFDAVRRVTIFMLGVLVFVDALFGNQDFTVPELIIGMIMVGVLPVENILGPMFRRRHDKDPDP